MPFDANFRGDPFRGDFPGRPDHERWAGLAAGAQREAGLLARRRHEPAARHELLALAQRRRRGQPEAGAGRHRPGSHRDDTITQFDFLPVTVGFDTLLVHGELLISGQSYDGRYPPGERRAPGSCAKPYLDELGVQAGEVGCAELDGRVVRLIHREMGPQELADLARGLRARGFAASLSNIMPTAGLHGPVTKGALHAVPGNDGLPVERGRPEQRAAGPQAKVAIIDTGRADQIRPDGWLRDIQGDTDPLDRFPQPSGDGSLDLAAGHGTFVAGIVQQIAPGAQITVHRAIDSDGIGSEVEVASEMIRAVKDGGAQVISLSFGCQTQDNVPPIAIAAALEIIGEQERETGQDVLIVAAAGNHADTIPCWPAAFPQVVSVAGLAPDLLPAQWSSRGPWVTCSTIGQGVLSTFVEGRQSGPGDRVPQEFGPDAWAVWSGTSFAAPQITGALALLHQSHGYPLREALRSLLAAGQPIPEFGQALKILPGL